jgi:autotransporter-associated beta strand protein
MSFLPLSVGRPAATLPPSASYAASVIKALAAIALAFAATPARAADYYWDANGNTGGTGGTGNWLTTSTWRLGSGVGTLGDWPNTGNNNAFFEGTAGQVTVGATAVTMGTGTALFNVTGYTLQTDASTTTRTVTGNVTIGSGLNLFINEANQTANRNLNIAGSITGGTMTLQGGQTGNNASRLNMSAANTTISSRIVLNGTGGGYTALVSSNTGNQITGAISNSSNTRTALGATSGNDLTLASTAIISGTSSLAFAAGSSGGAGTITLNSQSTYTGDTIFNAANSGVIKIGVSNAFPTTTNVTMGFSSSNGGILDLNGLNQEFASLTNGVGGGSIRNNGGGTSLLKISGTATPAASTLAIVDNTSGTGTVSIERAGTGSLTLSASNSYSGATTVSSGSLIAGNAFAFGTASGNLVAAGGVLDLGTFSIARTGTVSFTGGTVQTGTLTNNVVAYDGQAGRVSATLAGSAGLMKTTSGTLILGGSNAYTGPTTLSLGTLRSGTGTPGNFAFGTGTLALNGGTLTSGTDNTARTFANTVTVGGDVSFGDATATGGLAFTGTVNLGGASRTLTTVQSTTFSGPISNGGLAKAGSATLTLGGSNSYSLGTTITSGSLVVGNANALGSSSGSLAANDGTLDLAGFSVGVGTLSGSSGASITSAGPATLTATSNANSTYAGSLSGSVAFTKAGTGLLTLSGSSNSTGLTTVSSGTLAVNGTLGSGSVSVFAAAWVQGTGTIGGGVNVLGTLSAGNSPSPGVLTLGSVVLDAASNTAIDISGPVRGTDYDGVNITTSGGLTYGGTLSLSFGSLIGNDSTLDIFNFTGPSSGNYSSVLSTGSYAGLWTSLGSGTFQLVSGTQTLTFSQSTGDIIVVPEPAAFALVGAGVTLVSWVVRRRRGTLSTAC